MKKGDFLFVYGTLRKGERADLSKQERDFGVSFVCNDADITRPRYRICERVPGLTHRQAQRGIQKGLSE